MKRGIRSAKTPAQVKAEKRANSKGLGKAVAQIVGIGLVAGTALVLGTDKVMNKIFKKDAETAPAEAEADEE